MALFGGEDTSVVPNGGMLFFVQLSDLLTPLRLIHLEYTSRLAGRCYAGEAGEDV
jgi:hypothetical protein